MNKEIQTISPFKNFCVTIGALPTSYLESMSYYEMLCWLCKYLENTINPAINNNAEALKELQSYVANYFDNLDVTQQINDKLDEMAQDGTLAEIINVEMIGSLSDLTTTDKTDLVSAINEVNELTSYLSISRFETLTPNNTTNVSSINNHQVTLASNSDYSLFKLYGYIALEATDSNAESILMYQTNLRPDTRYDIVNCITSYNDNYLTTNYISVETDGTLKIAIRVVNKDEYVFAQLPAALYFNKDFGDTH